MPRSHNRRTIEVPVALYDELKACAERDGTTIPAALQALITDGKSMQEWFGQLDTQLAELRREVRELRNQLMSGSQATSIPKQTTG